MVGLWAALQRAAERSEPRGGRSARVKEILFGLIFRRTWMVMLFLQGMVTDLGNGMVLS